MRIFVDGLDLFQIRQQKYSQPFKSYKMKKLTFILMTTGLLILSFSKSNAQFTVSSGKKFSVTETMIVTEPRTEASEKTFLKAEKKFMKAYPDATHAEWTTLGDRSKMCRFFVNHDLHRAFYTANGQWISTFSSYDGNRLDKGIRDKIKSVYYDYSVVYADQIDLANNRTVYVVEIQDEKSIKKVRVDNDEMDVIQDFEKY
jgi:hypothetical protein